MSANSKNLPVFLDASKTETIGEVMLHWISGRWVQKYFNRYDADELSLPPSFDDLREIEINDDIVGYYLAEDSGLRRTK